MPKNLVKERTEFLELITQTERSIDEAISAMKLAEIEWHRKLLAPPVRGALLKEVVVMSVQAMAQFESLKTYRAAALAILRYGKTTLEKMKKRIEVKLEEAIEEESDN